jgi:hypothetical protein
MAAKAVEHREQPTIVGNVERAHDLADPSADHGQRRPGLYGGVAAFDL